MNDLRITDTNSANDSKGRAFGLEGNDFIYVLVAFVVGLALYLVFHFVFRTGMGIALGFALPLPLGATAWIVLLRHHKPAGYAEDVFDDLISGEGWSLNRRGQARSPMPEERHA